MRNKFFHAAILITLSSIVGGCQSNKGPGSIQKEEVLVKKSVSQLKAKRYTNAIDSLKKLNQDYMTSPKAQDYRLELMYAEFKAGEYDNAQATANQYVVMYPHEKYVDYALYLRSLSLYKTYEDWSPKRFSLQLGGRDPQPLRDAVQSLDIIIKKFPTSRYFYQASILQREIIEKLAERDFTIAKHYYGRHAYIASLERLKLVVESTQQQKLLDESLELMSLNYDKLGMKEMQANMQEIRKANAPKSKSLKTKKKDSKKKA